MPRFRKKPVIIEAIQMTRALRLDNRDWPEWLNEAWNKPNDEVGSVFCKPSIEQLFICTLEGVMRIIWRDWIIRGVKGELYPCKPDIFEMTYELVEEEDDDTSSQHRYI